MLVNTVNQLPKATSESGIHSVLKDFAKAWNEHNAKVFSLVFTEDADCTNVMGDSFHGRRAIEEKHEPLFKTIWAQSSLTIVNSKIRFIKQDVAAVDAWWTLEGLKTPDGKEREGRSGLLSFIMTQQPDNWMITVMHNMDLPLSKVQKC